MIKSEIQLARSKSFYVGIERSIQLVSNSRLHLWIIQSNRCVRRDEKKYWKITPWRHQKIPISKSLIRQCALMTLRVTMMNRIKIMSITYIFDKGRRLLLSILNFNILTTNITIIFHTRFHIDIKIKLTIKMRCKIN